MKPLAHFTHPPLLRTCIALMMSAGLLSACMVGPDYVKPATIAPDSYKELAGWKQAQPATVDMQSDWWLLFQDPLLNDLMRRVEINNQNVALAEAQYRQALATVDSSRSSLFPVLSATGSASRSSSRSSGGSNGNNGVSSTSGSTTYSASLGASWDVDVWGRIRRGLEASNASAQASADDLAAARLSARSSLAQDYFQLRVTDAQIKLYDDTVAAFQRSLTLTQNQYASGVVAKADVITAQTQLKSAQASRLDLGVSRAKLEHAIALLIGEPASNFSIAVTEDRTVLPAIPLTVPSALLERRPDISAAERRAAAANASIGVAKAAYFPSLSLAASGGFDSNNFSKWFTGPSRIWSLGPSLAQTLFDGGARRAASDSAIAAFDGAVASYKQTVLTGFQEVEDYLAALRILEQEAAVQDDTVASARQAVDLTLNQYRSGVVNYSNVVTAQATALSAQRSALDIRSSRLTSAVQLIAALGGGWHADADNASETTSDHSAAPSAPSAEAHE
jgi:NodT family efflux transporter outer membrane factor (OMF) lipoprotein